MSSSGEISKEMTVKQMRTDAEVTAALKPRGSFSTRGPFDVGKTLSHILWTSSDDGVFEIVSEQVGKWVSGASALVVPVLCSFTNPDFVSLRSTFNCMTWHGATFPPFHVSESTRRALTCPGSSATTKFTSWNHDAASTLQETESSQTQS